MRTEEAIAIGVLLTLFFLVSSGTATIHVPDNYETIQAAVEAASLGDTIIVSDGMYIENIEVNKSLTIRSENGSNSTFVWAKYPGYDVFNVTADHVAISGFTAEGAIGAAGISLLYAEYCNISDNHCTYNYDGISIANSNKNRIANNSCTANLLAGIAIRSSANNKLSDNCMQDGGIWVESDSIANYTHEIDESNTVNGKPLYYWNDVADGRVPDAAGQVILVNCTNITVEGQNVNNASIGIAIAFSSDVAIRNNICSYNTYALLLKYSSNTKLNANVMVENGILIQGNSLHDYMHQIDTSNTVNGKPVYYCKDVDGGRVPDGAGQVIVANCTNIIVEDQNVNNASIGIAVAFSSDLAIRNNNCSYNQFGILFEYSNSNHIEHNTVNANSLDGIQLRSHSNNNILAYNSANSNSGAGIRCFRYSNKNLIANNTAKNNTNNGIFLDESNNNKIYSNNASNNDDNGISVCLSNNNDIRNNLANDNDYYGIVLWSSDENIIANNRAKNNSDNGIYLDDSTTNSIANNSCSNNGDKGIALKYSATNSIANNTCSRNEYGIDFFVAANNSITNSNCSNNTNTGIYLSYSSDNKICDNDASNNVNHHGITLDASQNNEVVGNTVDSNLQAGIVLVIASENIIADNTARNNGYSGIYLGDSKNNSVAGNSANSNLQAGIVLWTSDDNMIANNTAQNNGNNGICLNYSSCNNSIYLNNVVDNTVNANSLNSTNIWHSPSTITYTYSGNTYTKYLGNYWDDYTGTDSDEDGIGDAYYSIGRDRDNYPLMMPWASYFK